MKIEHLAIWVNDLELMKTFYQKYFNGKPDVKYNNPKKNFNSYFIEFTGDCRLELMNKPDIPDNLNSSILEYTGIIHFAISVGSKNKVDSLTDELRNDGYTVIGEPRITGDGYYESVILDPENNRIEITT